jgi:uncharacterized RDD family membrane protein YckC
LEQQTDLLNELSIEETLIPVSKLLRFFNLIIDLAVVYLLCIVAGFVLAIFGESLYAFRTKNPNGFEYFIFCTPFVIFILYYFLMEAFAGGRTIGKMITGSKTVDIYGMPIPMKTAFLRSLIRLIPIEPFSAFGILPWHDLWTYSMVIKRSGKQ